MVKNNHNISNELLLKLEQALDNELISDKVLFIFNDRGQKEEKLSENLIIKILDKFLNIDNPLMMQQYMSVIYSIIQEKDFFQLHSKTDLSQINDEFSGTKSTFISRIQTALIRGIEKVNRDVVNKSVIGFKILTSIPEVELEENSKYVLVNLATSAICDEKLKQKMSTLIDVSTVEESQRCRFQLSYLKYDSNDQLLDELTAFSHPELLPQNFDQIDLIINNCLESELITKALNILLQCSNKQNIPDKLLDSITILLASTITIEIKSLCFQLSVEIAKVDRKFTDEVIFLIAIQDNEKDVNHILQLIVRNQPIPTELQDRINLSLQIDNPTCLDKNLKHIQEKLHLRNLIQQRLSNKEINNKYIDNLASNMISKPKTFVFNKNSR